MLLERHPDIAEACAFGLPDPVSGEAVAVAVVMRPGASGTDEAIKDWCRKHIRAEAVPSLIFRLAEIPRNERGKIVRNVVRETAFPFGPPRNNGGAPSHAAASWRRSVSSCGRSAAWKRFASAAATGTVIQRSCAT